MNKLIAALVAGLFAVGSFAQTPPAPVHAPAAKHAPKHAKKKTAHKVKVKHAAHKAHAV